MEPIISSPIHVKIRFAYLGLLILLMPNLPTYGWLHRCEDCEIITSRILKINHKYKKKMLYVCIPCRPQFIRYLFDDFKYVIIKQDTPGEMTLAVS